MAGFKRKFIGEVVSDKMKKTVIVSVTILKTHPKYHKQYRQTKKYAAHTTSDEYKIGDKVIIEEATPKSRTKNWAVVGKV